MKNMQVIDGADNCSYSIYAFTDQEFLVLFPEPGQNVEFIEDASERVGEDRLGHILKNVWRRMVNKRDVNGLHGILFYELENKRKFYPTKKEIEALIRSGTGDNSHGKPHRDAKSSENHLKGHRNVYPCRTARSGQ